MQNLSSTTGLNQHLERRHPAAFEEWKTLQINLQAEKMSTKRTLNDRFDDLEGVKLINIYFIIVAFEKIIVYIAIHEKIIVLNEGIREIYRLYHNSRENYRTKTMAFEKFIV